MLAENKALNNAGKIYITTVFLIIEFVLLEEKINFRIFLVILNLQKKN